MSYRARYARLRKRSAFEDERILRKDVLSRWGSRKAKAVSRRDMFRFAVGQAILDVSPCDQVERPSSENERNRVLSEEEIRILWLALDSAPMEPNARRILRVMLATGQRKGEVVGLHAQEIDFDKGLWVLPGSRAKNGREHLIPLSDAALRVLAEAPANENGYLFPSKLTGKPYRGQSIDHATRYLFDPRPVSKPKRSPQRQRQAPPLAGLMERFTPHDLRRTVATRMRELGISRGDVKMVLNHVETDVTARYDRYDGLAEKRRAIDLWAKRLEQIVTDERANEIGRHPRSRLTQPRQIAPKRHSRVPGELPPRT